ncbi:hypothetical protein DRN86_04690 [Candidatus Geothermarchaeota archaeon]|nr:MAG: hypothetical protein DRN86_04690 [Candidatus Geothermarchaeota archaeon]
MRLVGAFLIVVLLITPVLVVAQPPEIKVVVKPGAISISEDVKEGIVRSAKEIIMKTIPEWEEYKSIRSICKITEEKDGVYTIVMAVELHKENKELYTKLLFEYDSKSGEYLIKKKPEASETTEAPQSAPALRVHINVYSKFELKPEEEGGIRKVAEEIIEEKINVKSYGGLGADCYVLRKIGDWFIVYMKILSKPLPSTPEASEGRAFAWETVFKWASAKNYEVVSFSEVEPEEIVPEEVKSSAIEVAKTSEEVKSFLTESRGNVSVQGRWINRHDEVVEIKCSVTVPLNETHSLYKDLSAYVDIDDKEVLFVEKKEGVWYAPPSSPTPTPGVKPRSEVLGELTAENQESLIQVGAILILVAVSITALLAYKSKR